MIPEEAAIELQAETQEHIRRAVIPEAAVGAAALATYGSECASLWADEEPKVKAYYLEAARAALEAAAPHMLAPVDIEDRENAAWWQARIDERNAGAAK